jgi:hypothetical protein
VARSRASRRHQRGAALLALLAVAVMTFGYVLASRLNAASQFVAANRDHNAQVLAQAKRALIGWMVLNAASNDGNPGRLPCPEALANFADTTETSQGVAAPNCTLPAVGRLPWRTLGLEKLVDSAGEPLWYVVSPGWALPSSTGTLTINSDSVGQLTIDGNEAVALVIAPGAVMVAQAGSGCTAWTQSRPREATGVQPDLRNYLECENANSPADTSFVGQRTGVTFNDQVLRISAAELIPRLEPVIVERMQRQIAPSMKSAAYTSTVYSGLPASTPLYPYPRPFQDPTASNYVGQAWNANPQGLLPVNSIASSCAAPSPCAGLLPITHASSVRSTLSGYLMSYSCSISSTEVLCEGQYHQEDTDPTLNVRLEMAVTFNDYLLGFRALAASPASQTLVEARDNGSAAAWTTVAATIVQVRINDGSTALPDGSVPPHGSMTVRFRATLPNIGTYGWGTYADFRMHLNRAVVTDHALANRNDATVGWFVRNEWHRYIYYAVAQANTGDWLPSIGCSAASGNCIRYIDSGTYNIRALLLFAGRAVAPQTRLTGADRDQRTNYVEGANADTGTHYEQHLVRRGSTWTDRAILVDWDPASPPNASQAVSLSPVRLVVLP